MHQGSRKSANQRIYHELQFLSNTIFANSLLHIDVPISFFFTTIHVLTLIIQSGVERMTVPFITQKNNPCNTIPFAGP